VCITPSAVVLIWLPEKDRPLLIVRVSGGTVPKAEYDRLAKAAEIARKCAIEAQSNLEAHIDEHGCRDGDGGEEAA